MIKDEGRTRRVTLSRASGVLVVVLSALLVLSQLAQPRDRAVACSAGTLRVEGSSVFMETVRSIAEAYMELCGEARIETSANGSLAGVRNVALSKGGQLFALSDGRRRGYDHLYTQKLAIAEFHVVVNSGVGVTTLSIEDLRRINRGELTDWRQVRGGDSLPIRIVSRDADSGTRQLYEERVLGTGENVTSSSECRTADRIRGANVIRCERHDNAEVIREVSTIPGAIGYADAHSLTEARRAGSVTSLTLDGRAFDAATAVESGYPFWTVEYVYLKAKPAPGSLTANFLGFLQSGAASWSRASARAPRPTACWRCAT
ncbi:substrate-binding domain-containing protein [Nonomuraea antimicrobica]